MGLLNRCFVCALHQANKTDSIFWFNKWDRWATMYSRLSTILLVLGLVITLQCLAYTEAINAKWTHLRLKTGKKSLGNKLVWFLKLMTKQKILKNLSFRMSIYSAFCHKEVYSSSWTWKTQNVQDEKKAVKTDKTSITKMIAR